MTVENYFLDCRKSNTSNNFESKSQIETIKTYILNLEQKVTSLAVSYGR